MLKKKKVQKEEKGYFKMINLVTLLLLSTILIPESLAADPGHAAQAISKGMFESGERHIILFGRRRMMLNE